MVLHAHKLAQAATNKRNVAFVIFVACVVAAVMPEYSALISYLTLTANLLAIAEA